MGLIEDYLQALADHRLMGARNERHGYPALRTMLDGVGAGLSPVVRCVTDPQGSGGDQPDVAFYTFGQFDRQGGGLMPGALPDRGVAEVKKPEADLRQIAGGEQVGRYLERFGLVLVTNYREFLLLDRVHRDPAKPLEFCALADSADEWAEALRHPARAAKQRGLPVLECLGRALRAAAPLSDPKDLAWYLASYAREARFLLEIRPEAEWSQFQEALEVSLGVRFEGDEGRRFFRASLVQTLFYGVFSAWVLWHHSPEGRDAGARFDWRVTGHLLALPVMATLFQRASAPG